MLITNQPTFEILNGRHATDNFENEDVVVEIGIEHLVQHLDSVGQCKILEGLAEFRIDTRYVTLIKYL